MKLIKNEFGYISDNDPGNGGFYFVIFMGVILAVPTIIYAVSQLK